MRLVILFIALSFSISLAAGSLVAAADGAPDTHGWAGQSGVSWHWILPPTANGLQPNQSWHAIAGAGDGAIYVAGMDHLTNSALYRIDPETRALVSVGDARAASEAAGNWTAGETVEKFHTRPLWHKGSVYVASMNRSSLNSDYLDVRGFHWYAYEAQQKIFRDLSAVEPGGASAEHGNIVATASDPKRNRIYGASVPTADLFLYDVASGTTKNLWRPATFDRPYVYTGRVMWVDSRGRLYFTAGNPINGAHDPAIYAHVYFYDPDTGFGERTDFKLQEPRALESGQCLDKGRRCVFTDDAGHIYLFEDAGPSWRYIGQIDRQNQWSFIWMMQVSADARTLFASTSLGVKPSVLFAFDLATGVTRPLCRIGDLDPALAGYEIHTGANAWDRKGRFYFASSGPRGVIVTRLDPAALLRNGVQGSPCKAPAKTR